jgi:hypothetical protein
MILQYDKQDRQGNVAFNERSPHPTQQQAPAARSPGGQTCIEYFSIKLQKIFHKRSTKWRYLQYGNQNMRYREI